MITYDPGRLAIGFIWQRHGSVIPRALVWALPAAAIAYIVGRLQHDGDVDFDLNPDDSNMRTLWSSSQFILGFLCVFRTQQAYGRYMEGALLLRQMRTEWVNAFSSLVAFARRDESRRDEVERFQHYLLRLMSLLSCYTLLSMSDSVSEEMPVVSLPGFDTGCIAFLQSKPSYTQRSEIVKQWIQRLVVEHNTNGDFIVAPPILATFFQAFDRGVSYGSQARNLTDIPFPYAYAQVMTVMLILHSLLTPLIAGLIMYSAPWGAVFTFISVLAFWSTNYVACEIESPFGDDDNDLPLINIQQDMNASFWTQLEHQTQIVPAFDFQKSLHRKWSVQMIGQPVAEGIDKQASADSFRTMSPKNSRRSSLFDTGSAMNWAKPIIDILEHPSSPKGKGSPYLKKKSSTLEMDKTLSLGRASRASSLRSPTNNAMSDLDEPTSCSDVGQIENYSDNASSGPACVLADISEELKLQSDMDHCMAKLYGITNSTSTTSKNAKASPERNGYHVASTPNLASARANNILLVTPQVCVSPALCPLTPPVSLRECSQPVQLSEVGFDNPAVDPL